MDEDLTEKHKTLLTCANELCVRCSKLQCDGCSKLAKQCRSELDFLHRLAKKPMKLSQLNSTNLYHLQGVVEAAEMLDGVTSVLKRFHVPSLDRHVVVDVVCCQGQTWVKVIAKNSKALASDLNGEGEYGCKTLLMQAGDYQQTALCHPRQFVPPTVIFLFTGPVVGAVSTALSAVNVNCETVENVRNRTSKLFHSSHIPCSSQLYCNQDVGRVNLDVTTLISLVSNVCNGSSDIDLHDPVLKQQASEEQACPSLPIISQFIHNKHLYVCETALRDFRAIVDVVGGPNERQRADKLLARVTVVPDQPSERALSLPITSSVRQRARTVFGTGDSLRAVTTTANIGFVRATAQAGVEFVTFLHPARALTESKQLQQSSNKSSGAGTE